MEHLTSGEYLEKLTHGHPHILLRWSNEDIIQGHGNSLLNFRGQSTTTFSDIFSRKDWENKLNEEIRKFPGEFANQVRFYSVDDMDDSVSKHHKLDGLYLNENTANAPCVVFVGTDEKIVDGTKVRNKIGAVVKAACDKWKTC